MQTRSEALLHLDGRFATVRAAARTPVSDHFQPGRWLDVHERDIRTLSSVCGNYVRDAAVEGSWCSQHIHFFDFSLSGRPRSSNGCFIDAFGDNQQLGKTLFAPAGHRYNGKGGPGKQRSLFLFLRAEPLFPDEEWMGIDTSAALRNCLNLKGDAIDAILARIAQETMAPGFASEFLLEALGLTLLVESARLLRDANPVTLRKGGLAPWRLRIIKDRIWSGERHPRIAELAELCGISRRQLMRAFKEETGQSLGAFVRSLALERAKDLLVDDEPIGLIALKSGFSSAATFSTAFLRDTGQTPRDYRASKKSRRR